MKLSEILKIYKSNDVDSFFDSILGYNLNNKNLTKEKIEKNFRFVGGNESNASNIDMLQDGEKGIVERITNAIDAVIEKKKETHNIPTADKVDKIVKTAFPKYYENKNNIFNGSSNKNNAIDASNQVIVAVNDGTKTTTPTFDIIDKGTGIAGYDFSRTILSLQGGNKIKSEKNYLIGAFGQGGSTSLSFANATIIISMKDEKMYFTIVQSVELKGYKNHAYVYLTDENGNIMSLEKDCESFNDSYIKDFFDCETGTFIRMVDSEITKKFRDNDVNKPRSLGDYLNTELFGVGFPVYLIENRRCYLANDHVQNRHVYGGKLKLLTWKYYKKEYSGNIEIEHKGNVYTIEYYVILPSDENLWGKDSECKAVYNQINVHDKPIIYTVNGQYINGENFTKLKNAGLGFLQYRLLVNIDLDCLGIEKYKFFTTDRSKIKDSELTNGFVDKVIKNLAECETLKNLNQIIAEKSMKSSVDEDFVNQITEEIKDEYLDLLTNDGKKSFKPRNHTDIETEKPICYDYIESLFISNTKEIYKKDEAVRIMLITNAYKDINKAQTFYSYLDEKVVQAESVNFMNGRVQFVYTDLEVGKHSLRYAIFEGDTMRESNEYVFTIEKDKLEQKSESPKKHLNLQINPMQRDSCEYIIDVIRSDNGIVVNYCMEHACLDSLFYGMSQNDMDTKRLSLHKPMILFTLLLKDNYDKIESIEEKNNIIIAYLKSLMKII